MPRLLARVNLNCNSAKANPIRHTHKHTGPHPGYPCVSFCLSGSLFNCGQGNLPCVCVCVCAHHIPRLTQPLVDSLPFSTAFSFSAFPVLLLGLAERITCCHFSVCYVAFYKKSSQSERENFSTAFSFHIF